MTGPRPGLVVLDSTYGDVFVEQQAAAELGVDVWDQRTSPDRAPADGALVQHGAIGAAELDANPSWRVVGRYGVGFDTIDVPAATERGVAVVNVPDYCDEEVASHAAALTLAITRKVVRSAALVASGRWDDWNELRPIRPLSDLTLGVLGAGRIAVATIARLRPFFGDIVVHDPYAPAPPGTAAVGLDELFERSDVVTLHCPLNAATRHIVDADRLATMRPGGFLVNVSRGGLVDGAALAAALHSGHLTGAGLDVLEAEPPGPDDPLTAAPGALVTNHLAWYSTASEPRLRGLLAARCAGVLTGEAVPTVVNAAQLGGAA